MAKHRVKIIPEEEVPEKKSHHSTFLITINTNVAETRNSVFGRKFKQTLMSLSENIVSYLKVREGYPVDDSMTIKVEPRMEVGTKFHRLHAHILVSVDHDSNLLVDTKKITDETGFYVNSRFIKGAAELQKVLDYIRKEADKN